MIRRDAQFGRLYNVVIKKNAAVWRHFFIHYAGISGKDHPSR